MRFLIVFGILLGICVGVFSLVPPLRERVLDVSSAIKMFYIEKKDAATLFISDYTNQAAQIHDMREKIKSLEEKSIKYDATKAEFDNLYYTLNIERHYMDPDVHLVKVLSYATLGTYTKLWVEYEKEVNEAKIFGVVKDGYAIGIAKWVDNHLLAVLNGDKECSYGVYIGENRAPGTLRTLENGQIVIDYIPAWQSIKKGDVVRTSGLDGIFFEDVEVGTLGNIKSLNGYLQAEILTHTYSNKLSYMWLVDTNIDQSIQLNENNLEIDG